MRHQAVIAAALATACVALRAPGQTAIVTTSVNGGGTATIAPGGSVSVSVWIAHDQFSVAGIQGGTVVEGNAGVGSNFSTTIPSLPTVNTGSFVGGSRVGADIAFVPPNGGFWGPTPPSGTNPMPVWRYDLTLTEPGEYDIVWVPTATGPNVRLYASIGTLSFVEAQTTYVSARITVTPGVGTGSMMGLGGLWFGSRRRRVCG